MKEFTSQTGGRYTYIDDIMNLQNLALAFTSIFDECDNFIISGCQVSGTSISAGYVYINGKIRYCAGTSGVSKWPMYLYENNSVERVSYADSGDKNGRNIYGCAVSSSVPIANDVLTEAPPQFISITSDGTALRLKEALFGKYALMIDSPNSVQTVQKDVVIDGTVTANKDLTAQKGINLTSGTAKASITYNASGALSIQSQLNGKPVYKVTITEDGAIQFYIGDTLLASLDSNGMTLKVTMSLNSIKAGNIVVASNHIYNTGVAADTGSININMLGYNEGDSYYRDTKIGDGKNTVILEITGKSKASIFYGPVKISHISNKDLYIKNNIGNLVLNNDVYVTGKLFVGGIDVIARTIEYPKDSGWIAINVQNCGITTKLYVRQVGKVVSIQGELHTHHSGTIFTLPNTIDPPKYKIGYSHNKGRGNWHCTIQGGQRNCVVDYCNNGCSEYIGFLMTYII